MWDLETLHYLNEQAYLSSLRMVNRGIDDGISDRTTISSPPASDPVFPLAILSLKLITGPPALSRLIDLLEDSDSVAEFLGLVREYLPEHEAEIMAQNHDLGRIERFCHYFGNRYFPLEDIDGRYTDGDFLISDFIRYIPVGLMGFTWDDYEEFNQFRDGFILLLSLVESPYDPNERVPILERVKELVGRSLLELIPQEGWTLEHIHRTFDDSEYEGVVAFSDWVQSCTGCWLLDADYENYQGEQWDRRIVDTLTEQWPEIIDLNEKMQKMYEWLEEDIHHNFEQLLAILRGVKYVSIPKEQIPLPLDGEGQVIKEEVI